MWNQQFTWDLNEADQVTAMRCDRFSAHETNPRWSFLVSQYTVCMVWQFMTVDVWDEDTGTDDHIGACRVNLSDVKTKGTQHAWFEVFGLKSGKSHGKILLNVSTTRCQLCC